jgi:hypothetical protein
MKIIFWNTHKNKDHTSAVKLVDNTKIDLLFLAECSEELLAELRKTYHEVIVPSSKSKVRCFRVNRAISCQCMREIGSNLVIFHVELDAVKCTLGVLHLRSKPHADPYLQHDFARDCITGINRYEYENQNMDTVLIGDFNMNPFDPGMVLSRGFNSVCSQ